MHLQGILSWCSNVLSINGNLSFLLTNELIKPSMKSVYDQQTVNDKSVWMTVIRAKNFIQPVVTWQALIILRSVGKHYVCLNLSRYDEQKYGIYFFFWRKLLQGQQCEIVQCTDNVNNLRVQSGNWGCCRYENAVCCDDRVHCCPSGSRCDQAGQRCLSDSVRQSFYCLTLKLFNVPWIVFLLVN